jgi:hypothetical protein
MSASTPGGRPVAVKLVRPELAGDGVFIRRFALEVAAARRVGGFYTAQVVDADPDAEPPWLVTAYVPGPSLHEAIQAHGPLPAAAISVLGAGLAEGLAAIHGCGLVHRDLKPGNVILADDGPRVIDFGIARALDVTHHTSSIVGTPAFMSPEQGRGDPVGPQSDVFSLGSVLAFAATGNSPFGTGPAHAIIYRIIHDHPDLTGLPAHLSDLIAACLAKTPADRPALTTVLGRLTTGDDHPTRWLPEAITTMIAERAAATRALTHTTPTNPSGPGGSPPPPGPPGPHTERSDRPATEPYATPRAREMAERFGIDLATVKGTGVGGRIRMQDVVAVVHAMRGPDGGLPEPRSVPPSEKGRDRSRRDGYGILAWIGLIGAYGAIFGDFWAFNALFDKKSIAFAIAGPVALFGSARAGLDLWFRGAQRGQRGP